jgi:hypothetical protein
MDESERDQRLTSTSTVELNRDSTIPSQQTVSLSCYLQEARWSQVCLVHHSARPFTSLYSRRVRSLCRTSISMRNRVTWSVSLDLLVQEKYWKSLMIRLVYDHWLHRVHCYKHSLARLPPSMAKCDFVAHSAMYLKSHVRPTFYLLISRTVTCLCRDFLFNTEKQHPVRQRI